MGNLFTSFFIASFKGKKTIMARNGGVLNGIYRTSYFVLDRVKSTKEESSYRFVDAYGGEKIMWIEVLFRGQSMTMKAYTSRMGERAPSIHMEFKAKKNHLQLSATAAKKLGFPKNVIDSNFAKKGLPKPKWLQQGIQRSASYLWKQKGLSVSALGKAAGDPLTIDQMPYLAKLTIQIQPSLATKGKRLLVYLSHKALTDKDGYFLTQQGYLREDRSDSILLFPELAASQRSFTLTYLHPGTYYLTVIADMDGDQLPSPGDRTHPLQKITIKAKESAKLSVGKLSVQN